MLVAVVIVAVASLMVVRVAWCVCVCVRELCGRVVAGVVVVVMSVGGDLVALWGVALRFTAINGCVMCLHVRVL